MFGSSTSFQYSNLFNESQLLHIFLLFILMINFRSQTFTFRLYLCLLSLVRQMRRSCGLCLDLGPPIFTLLRTSHWASPWLTPDTLCLDIYWMVFSQVWWIAFTRALKVNLGRKLRFFYIKDMINNIICFVFWYQTNPMFSLSRRINVQL